MSSVFESINNTQAFFSQVKECLEKENRFFVSEIFIAAFKEILKLKTAKIIVEPHTIYYRGRIYREEDDINHYDRSVFQGYDEKGSGINPNDRWPKAGRLNPEGIQVLYVATGETTCAKEIGAAAGETVNVARMEVKQQLTLIDFPRLEKNIKGIKKKQFVSEINNVLSNGYGGRDYVLTQYIASVCRVLGYDGIIYRSKYAAKTETKKGLNIGIFDPNKCRPISSVIREVNRISLGFKQKS